MRDINRPYMGILVDGFRYYTQKKTGDIKPSKEWKFRVVIMGHSCRDELLQDFHSNLYEITHNSATDDKYITYFSPHRINEVNNKEHKGSLEIYLKMTGFDQMRYMSKPIGFDNFSKFCHIVLGLMDTVFYNSEERMKSKQGMDLTESIYLDDRTIYYNGLSPEWVNNPYTMSLLFGLFRDCLLLCTDNEIDESEFLSQFDINDIYDIILNGEVKKARDILMKKVIPYFNTDGIAGVYYLVEDDELYDEEEDEWRDDGDEWEFEDDSVEICILSNYKIQETVEYLLNRNIYDVFSHNFWSNWGLDDVYEIGISHFYYNFDVGGS